MYSDPAASLDFYDSVRRSAHLQPEKRLMLALLDEALKCFRKHMGSKSRRGKRLFTEVEEWFGDKESEHVFSFENVCTILGLSPGYLRRMLGQWRMEEQTDPAPNGRAPGSAPKARRRLRYAA
jgi:hypothetical protein